MRRPLGTGRTILLIFFGLAVLLGWSWLVRMRSVHVEHVYGESSAKSYAIQCTVVNPRAEEEDVRLIVSVLGNQKVGPQHGPCVLAEQSRDLTLQSKERRELTFEFERIPSFRMLSCPQVLVHAL